MIRLYIKCFIIFLIFLLSLCVIIYAYKTINNTVVLIVSEEIINDDCKNYVDVEDRLLKKKYKRMEIRPFNSLILVHHSPLYIFPGDSYSIYFNDETNQVNICQSEDSLFLNIYSGNESKSVYMFIPKIPDTIISANKGYSQMLNIVDFNKDDYTTILINDATMVLASNIEKLNVFMNNGRFDCVEFNEFFFFDNERDYSITLNIDMIDSYLFFNSYLTNSIEMLIKTENSWFDISVENNYVNFMDIEGTLKATTEGGRNSTLSLMPRTGKLLCDSISLNLRERKYLDIIKSDSVVFMHTHFEN
jgi:hypothetical protein